MALVVGTNSYVTVAEAAAYVSDRIDTEMWDTATPEDQARALVTATRLLDVKAYVGQMAVATQALAWPRVNAVFHDPKFGGVVQFPSTLVPERLKRAVIEQALHILSNENLLETKALEFERIKVGPIEIEGSSENYTPTPKESPLIMDLIRPLLSAKSTSQLWWRAN